MFSWDVNCGNESETVLFQIHNSEECVVCKIMGKSVCDCNFLYVCLVLRFSSALLKCFVITARKQICAAAKWVRNDGCRQENYIFVINLLYYFVHFDLLIFMIHTHYSECHYHPNRCTFYVLSVSSTNFFPSIYTLYEQLKLCGGTFHPNGYTLCRYIIAKHIDT